MFKKKKKKNLGSSVMGQILPVISIIGSLTHLLFLIMARSIIINHQVTSRLRVKYIKYKFSLICAANLHLYHF